MKKFKVCLLVLLLVCLTLVARLQLKIPNLSKNKLSKSFPKWGLFSW